MEVYSTSPARPGLYEAGYFDSYEGSRGVDARAGEDFFTFHSLNVIKKSDGAIKIYLRKAG